MLTLGIRYLTGSVAASDVADRDAVEWPPHPGRVFMALAAAHFQTGEDPRERTALEWLETLPAPELAAGEHQTRTSVTHFVPVNDRDGLKGTPLASAPGAVRIRQPRTFARAWLADDTVFLHWPTTDATDHLASLESLAGKVTRIGHSISLVQCWFCATAPSSPTNWLPDDARQEFKLRIPGKGALAGLEQRFDHDADARMLEYSRLEIAHRDAKGSAKTAARKAMEQTFPDGAPFRLRPALSLAQGYSRREEAPAADAGATVFDPRLLVLTLERDEAPFRFLDSLATLQVTARLREALMWHLGRDGGGPIPEILSGHSPTGASQSPHIAYVSLPFVGHEHAHGGLLGLAFAIPREIPPETRQRLLRAVHALRDPQDGGLKLGPLGRWKLHAPDSGSALSIRDRVWTAAPAGAMAWSTVTPYVHDRHAKAKDKAAYLAEVAEAVRGSWTRVRTEAPGLTPAELVEVTVTPVSRHFGVPAAGEFPRLRRKDGSLCRHAHLVLRFDRPVIGPLLLGAGRYFGYGFCRPV
jgi:CRISPR-associated protein Csb2